MSENVTDHPHGPAPHGEHVTGAAPPHGDAAALPFSDAEWQGLKKSDVTMGGLVVGLMTGIFTIGLLLYSAILWLIL
jgi:hypothetical protein